MKYKFTRTQEETLELLAHGYTNEDMAKHLNKSVRTIEDRLSKIKDKIKAETGETLNHRALAIFAYQYIEANGGLPDED